MAEKIRLSDSGNLGLSVTFSLYKMGLKKSGRNKAVSQQKKKRLAARTCRRYYQAPSQVGIINDRTLRHRY